MHARFIINREHVCGISNQTNDINISGMPNVIIAEKVLSFVLCFILSSAQLTRLLKVASYVSPLPPTQDFHPRDLFKKEL